MTLHRKADIHRITVEWKQDLKEYRAANTLCRIY